MFQPAENYVILSRNVCTTQQLRLLPLFCCSDVPTASLNASLCYVSRAVEDVIEEHMRKTISLKTEYVIFSKNATRW